jgi:epoxide hydrolase-like predicted phosphatase
MKKNTGIQAILFDFMGVLLFPRVNINPNKIRDEIDEIIGQVTDDINFKNETMAKYKFNELQFYRVLEDIANKYEKFKALWDLLPRLRKQYKLAIINNGTALTLPILKRIHQLDQHFDLFISSAVEGVKKPDPKIFRLTAKRLKVDLEKCLFMDDNEENIDSAGKLGIKTIHWQNKQSGFKKFVDFIY